jgi:hypothetical protein
MKKISYKKNEVEHLVKKLHYICFSLQALGDYSMDNDINLKEEIYNFFIDSKDKPLNQLFDIFYTLSEPLNYDDLIEDLDNIQLWEEYKNK